MHLLLKVSICLVLLITGLHGFFVAEQTAEQYPLHATATIDIVAVPQESNIAERLITASEDTSAPMGRVRYSSTENGPVQTIALTSAASQLTAPQDHKQVFGFTLTTRVTVFEVTDEVTGRWVSFGTEAQTADLVDRLTDDRFTVEWTKMTFHNQARSFLADLPMLLIELAGFLAVFVAAMVSAAQNTRVRAVQQLFGVSGLRTVATETGKYVAFIAIALITTLFLWGSLAVVGWGGMDSFSGVGLLVVAPIVVAAFFCAAMCAAGPAIAAVTVNRITEQIAGKRPLRFIQAASTLAFIVVMIGAFIGIDRVVSSTQQLNAAIRSQDVWSEEPDARSFALANTPENVIQQNLPGWTRTVRTIATDHGLLLSYLQAPCSLRPDHGPCLFVNNTYIQRTPIEDVDGDYLVPVKGGVQAYLPEPLDADGEFVRERLNDWVEFQQSLLKTEIGGDLAASATPNAPSLLASRQILPVYSSQYRPHEATVEDPLLIVLDDATYSGDLSLSAASSGNLILFAPGDILSRLVDEAGIRSLVFSIDRPADLAAGTAVQARTALLRNGLTFAASFALAFALLVVLSAGYVARQRKQLFLGYLHGIPFLRRYAGYLTFLLSIVVLSVLISIGLGLNNQTEWIAIRTGLGATLILAIIPLLAASERRFRADFLKHP